MENQRTRNATRNIIFGIVLKIYQIIAPFIIRTALIYFMGIQYLGLNSLFASVLQVLNLAELGVGSAMVYSMYRPIAENDKNQICCLLNLYRLYYRIIGFVILGIGLVAIPFLPRLISGTVPSGINIYVLYLLNLAVTILSYWLFAYKNSLFLAHQRVDIGSKVTIITTSVQYILQLFVLIVVKNYYWYIIMAMFSQILNNIIISIAADKIYPMYKPEGKLSHSEIKEINHRIRDLFTSKLGAVIVNSADSLVISAFLGLTVLAVYNNYYYILTSIIGIVSVVFSSCTAGIGNSIIVESREKNYNDLKILTLIISWISGFCACCLLCLYQPFMQLWVGKEYMLEFNVVICFCIYYFIYEINQLLNVYKDAAGLWHEDRFRPLITGIVNVGLNLFFVNSIGIYGVILSTVVSMLIVGMPWLLHNLFRTLFKRSMYEYLKVLLYYCMITVVGGAITLMCCEKIRFDGILNIIVRFIICLIVPNIIFLVCFYRVKEFKESMGLINRITKGKIKFLKKLC